MLSPLQEQTMTGKMAAPTAVLERIQIVDVLRGMALGGILIANMADFTSPFYSLSLDVLWPEAWNRAVLAFIDIFVTGNFFTIFSFLFGLGLALQMIRLEARGISFAPVYVRRQGILLCIGLGHGLLVWYGDILAPYAIFGCFLLLFRRQAPMKLVLLAAVLVCGPIVISIARMSMAPDMVLLAQGSSSVDPNAMAAAQHVISVYAHGSWTEIFRLRAEELITNYNGWIGRSYGTTVFAMFLLGLAAGRANVFNNLERQMRLIRICWYVGGIWIVIRIAGVVYFPALESRTGAIALYEVQKIAHIFICLFYIASVILLARNERWKRVLSLLAAPGRMALTNYLLQSIVFTTLCNSYGLGLFGRISPLTGLGIAVAFFACQVLASNWYLSRYRFGPAEWLWKSLTYGKSQTFLRTHSSAF
jgi:uncharacterized protein